MPDIAKELDLPLSTLQRWSHLYCWDDARAERERFLINRVQGVRRALVPDIDRRHDAMFSSLESLLETTMRELTDSGQMVPPNHLKTLASTLALCQSGRRTVHKKEQSISKHVHELQENPEVYESFVRTLTDISSKTEAKLRETIMDAEFEEVVDDEDTES